MGTWQGLPRVTGQGLGAVPWEEESGGADTVAVGVEVDGGNGSVCIAQALHTGRCTHGLSCGDSLWACT